MHRDLKPENIFVNTDPQTSELTLKIGDFGLCKELINKSATISMAGTRTYSSPEVIEEVSCGFPSDMFSLGLILYELCTLECFVTPKVILDI